jgi:hypothetical protein
MNSKKDFDELMKKYNEAIAYSFPKFMVLPYVENRFNEINKMGIPMSQPMGITNKNIPVNFQPVLPFPKFSNMPPYSNKYFKF